MRVQVVLDVVVDPDVVLSYRECGQRMTKADVLRKIETSLNTGDFGTVEIFLGRKAKKGSAVIPVRHVY